MMARTLLLLCAVITAIIVLIIFIGGEDYPCDHPSTPDEVARSLYTVFLEGARTEIASPLPSLLPLVTAADRIYCDPDTARRRGRMRYAATKLAAAHTLLKRKLAPMGHLALFVGALHRLRFPPSIVDDLTSSPSTSLVALENEAGDRIDTSTQSAAVEFKRQCCPCIEHCDVGSQDSVAGVQFEVDVARKPQELFQVIDPVSWAALLPQYFDQTDEIDGAPACQNGTPVCFHNDGPCRPGAEPSPAVALHHATGTPWCGLLHERFKAQWTTITLPTPSASFANVLGVRAQYEPTGATIDTATGYKVDYKLCEALGHTSGGIAGDCGLEIDCGFTEVRDDGLGDTKLFAMKEVAFLQTLNPDANAWAPIALEVLVKETALTMCIGTTAESDCTCANDGCWQHAQYAPTWPADFCE